MPRSLCRWTVCGAAFLGGLNCAAALAADDPAHDTTLEMASEAPAAAAAPLASANESYGTLLSFRRDGHAGRSGQPLAPVTTDLIEPLDADDLEPPVAAHADRPPAMPPALASLPAPAAGAAPLLDDDPRRLAPPNSSTARSSATPGAALVERLSIPWDRGALTSTATALGVVIGLLLATSWLLKRGQPRTPGQLPPEAFCVLGRAILPDRTPVQLLRLGSKLVLVANHQDQVRPLAEITDPLEVERLAGICQQSHQVGPAAEFQQVLQQLSREPARGFLGSEGLRG